VLGMLLSACPEDGREVPLQAIVQAIARPLRSMAWETGLMLSRTRPQACRARGPPRLAIPPRPPFHLSIRPPPFPNRRASMRPTLPLSARLLPPVAE
jgi:hypothetical protein